jgi:hypothetical protein
MAQAPNSCRKCGTVVPENTTFCPNCGTLLRTETGEFTGYSNWEASSPPPPPPPGTYAQATDMSYSTTPPQGTSGYQSATPDQQGRTTHGQNYGQPPADRQARKPISPGKQRRSVILPLILLVVILMGTGGYFTWRYINSKTNNSGNANAKNTTTNTGSTGSSSGAGSITPTSTSNGGTKTTPINLTVTYADDVITVLDAKQASGFPDENASGEILRLDIQEQTGTKAPYFGTYGYSSGASLILPDGNSAALVNTRTGNYDLAASVSRTNWLDFQVPVSTPVDQIVLCLGQSTEHQIDVPLKEHADVSKYQPRTANVNKLIEYGGLNWTLTTAVWRLSAEGVQADKDMSYVVLSLSVDNPSATGMYLNQAVADAFRLTAEGTTTVASKYNTLPMSIAGGETKKTGTVGFLVPSESINFTLVMPIYDRGGVVSTVQVTTDFQIK